MPKPGSQHKLINNTALDTLVHSPVRLIVVNLLYKANTMDFIQLMKTTGMTWGNLSTHLSKLDQGGYISITKTFNDKRPYTMFSLTELGRQAYLAWCRTVLDLMPGHVIKAWLGQAGELESGELEHTQPDNDQILDEHGFDELFIRVP